MWPKSYEYLVINFEYNCHSSAFVISPVLCKCLIGSNPISIYKLKPSANTHTLAPCFSFVLANLFVE